MHRPDCSPDDAQPRIDGVALDLWRSSTLANLYQPLLTRIVDASESAQVTLRTKALRAISAVVAQDPGLFHQENVRRSIEGRMLDSSPAVRDASIELVGKYVVGRPDLAVQYLPKLGERISDTSLGVRRRVIKLLKILYGMVDDEKHRLEISRRLVYRVLDEDDGIKVRTFAKPLFPRLDGCSYRNSQSRRSKTSGSARPSRTPLRRIRTPPSLSSPASSRRPPASTRSVRRLSTRRCA